MTYYCLRDACNSDFANRGCPPEEDYRVRVQTLQEWTKFLFLAASTSDRPAKRLHTNSP